MWNYKFPVDLKFLLVFPLVSCHIFCLIFFLFEGEHVEFLYVCVWQKKIKAIKWAIRKKRCLFWWNGEKKLLNIYYRFLHEACHCVSCAERQSHFSFTSRFKYHNRHFVDLKIIHKLSFEIEKTHTHHFFCLLLIPKICRERHCNEGNQNWN